MRAEGSGDESVCRRITKDEAARGILLAGVNPKFGLCCRQTAVGSRALIRWQMRPRQIGNTPRNFALKEVMQMTRLLFSAILAATLASQALATTGWIVMRWTSSASIGREWPFVA